jgi:hypothetical protein
LLKKFAGPGERGGVSPLVPHERFGWFAVREFIIDIQRE